MRAAMLFSMLRLIYPKYMRPVLHSAVNDPESDWDELLMSIIDRIFLYDQEE
jgi:hypothetical protein